VLTPGAGVSADAVDAHCLKDVLAQVRDHGWVHHIPRLMVLSNYALQRGWNPAAVTDWFHRCFVDGYDWVMVANVVGMSQHADGGLMATKPYAAGGAADEQALAGLRRLGDLDDVVEQQRRLGGRAP
jgi:deoxyribodipyrimidine photolyase-related protein